MFVLIGFFLESNIRIHSGYTVRYRRNDIAVMHLDSQPLSFSYKV